MDNTLLIKILRQNNRLVIPGFGAFLVKDTPSGRGCVFSPFLKRDDGVLSGELMREYALEQQDAQSMIEEYVAHIDGSIKANGHYSIAGIGSLEVDDNGALSLKAESAILDEDVVVSGDGADDYTAKLSDVSSAANPSRADGPAEVAVGESTGYKEESSTLAEQSAVAQSSPIFKDVGLAQPNSSMAQHSAFAQKEELNAQQNNRVANQNISGQGGVGQSPSSLSQRMSGQAQPLGGAAASSSVADRISGGEAISASEPSSRSWQSAGQASERQVGQSPQAIHSSRPAVGGDALQQGRRAVSANPIHGVSPTSTPTPVSRPIPSALTPGGVNPVRPVVTARGASPQAGGAPVGVVGGASGQRVGNASAAARPITASDATGRRAAGSAPVRRPAPGAKRPSRAKASSKTDVWLIAAIVAAAVVLGLMIYGFLVSNPTIDVEPMLEADTTIVITE